MRRTLPGHRVGAGCSTNPEIGCVCGEAERASERDEALIAPDAFPQQNGPDCWCGLVTQLDPESGTYLCEHGR